MPTAAIPEAAMRWKLASVGAITSVVAANQIQTGRLSQGTTFPNICIDRPPGQIISRISSGPGGLEKTSLIIYCYANEATGGYTKAMSVAGLVKAAIDGTGVTGSVQWNGTWIDHAIVSDVYDASEPPQDGGEVGRPCAAVAVDMWHMNCLGS